MNSEDNIGQRFRFKITVIGDGMVGKTTLIRRFTEGSFKKDYIKTLGAHISKHDKEIDDDTIRLIFWDIAGQEDFQFLRPQFLKNSRASIIVFSLEENDLGKKSFDHITDWHEIIKEYCGDIPIVLFANKADLVDGDDLDRSKFKEVTDNNGFHNYYVTSALTGEGVIEAFNDLINTLYKKFKELSTDL